MKEHRYALTVSWTGNQGTGTDGYRKYSRSHDILINGKAVIEASSDPAFLGDQSKHNPEELFLASLSSCHMLWYLHLCADAGIVVMSYTDHATGIMTEHTNGGGRFKEVTLQPVVALTDHSFKEKALQLHDEAHRLCFIANSCNFKIRHKASIID